MLNPFEQYTSSDRLRSPYYLSFLVFLLVLSALITSKMGLIGVSALIVLPFVFAYLTALFLYPILGLYSAIFIGYIVLGISRYVDFQSGVMMDGILVLTFIALFFKQYHQKIDLTPAKKDITLLALIWFGYSLFELINPEARSIAAWIASTRGVSFYMLLVIVLTLLFFDTNRKIGYFLMLWGFMSLLASVKGIIQQFIGVDPFEQAWLDSGEAKTHILFGKLRVFSFLSDAGQFGANQAYSAVVAGIVSMAEKDKVKKTFFIIVAVFAIYGMLLSGTRGAISIPLAGFGTYFILKKNKLVMFSGFVFMIAIFIFFKYTFIGQQNDQIRRMRTAFDPNDASFQVRLENQKILSNYLASRPFGGGMGHAGVKAKKYLPNAFLSNVATDSGYVMIWAEQGIVGLLLHLFILFYVVGKSSYQIMFRIRDPILQTRMAALTSGMCGIMVANYGNAVLQMPTGLLIYTSMALMLNSEKLDTHLGEPENRKKGENVPLYVPVRAIQSK
jgi:hypothetical protein